MSSTTPLIVQYKTQPCNPTEPFPTQTAVSRPAVKTILEWNGKQSTFAFLSVIDSGADFCTFPAAYGEALGLNIKSGKRQQAQGVAGADDVYFHQITVWVEIGGQPYHFSCWAGFMYSLASVGLLGRHGFFGLFESITFKHEAQVVELVPKTPIAPKS